MVNAHPSLQIVYAIVEPIPALGAERGDELIVTPTLDGFEVVVMKRFGLEMLAAIPENAVNQLSAEPFFCVQGCAHPPRPAAA